MISLAEFVKLSKGKNESFDNIYIALLNDDPKAKLGLAAKLDNTGNNDTSIINNDSILLEAIRMISKQKFGLELKSPGGVGVGGGPYG